MTAPRAPGYAAASSRRRPPEQDRPARAGINQVPRKRIGTHSTVGPGRAGINPTLRASSAGGLRLPRARVAWIDPPPEDHLRYAPWRFPRTHRDLPLASESETRDPGPARTGIDEPYQRTLEPRKMPPERQGTTNDAARQRRAADIAPTTG